MRDEGYSVQNGFGGYDHYDSSGNKIGSSEPSFFGGYVHYDSDGKETGYSTQDFCGSYSHYDSNGTRIGHSEENFFGSYDHYDSSGHRTGSSYQDFGGYSNHRSGNSSGGCYVATCVYGSYDCPEVWTLRRFRDNTLAQSWCGRAFIRLYYAVSPHIVQWFGQTSWFKRMWRGTLDKMVKRLQSDGVESTPYEDRRW